MKKLPVWFTVVGLPSLLAATPQSSNFEITTDEAFHAGSVPAYKGNHVAIYRYIDEHVDDHLANMQRWLRQPSVSAQNVGIQEMAMMLRDDLKALGFQELELVPTSRHPGVWGYYDAGAAKTLMVYLMYDVQYMVIRPKEGSAIAALPEIEKAYVDLLFALAEQ